jgi:hypothetical protein
MHEQGAAAERDYEAPALEELGTVEDYTEGIGVSIILIIN